MKIKNLVFAMMACAAFTACTNDELLDNRVDDNKQENSAFVAVNIVSTASIGSKALGDTETGSNEENRVNSAMFFFFDAAGNSCATPTTPTLDFAGSTADKIISKAILVLENATSIPTSIVAVMNPSTEITALKNTNTSLAALRTTVAEATELGKFIMSNSTYAGTNQTLVDATPISSDNICSTSAEALKSPVNIPVERVVAKISTTLANAHISNEEFLIDGEMTKIKVKLLGWKATALNPQSNLIKEINPTWTMAWWNDAPNFRSFWGTSRAATTYTYFPHTAIAANVGAEYCLENTTATTTKLIVAAQLQKENGLPIDLMEWKGAKNTKENMRVVLANTGNVKQYYTKNGTTYTTLAAQYIDFTTVGTSDASRYTVIAKLVAGAPEIYTLAGTTATVVTPEKVNETLKALGEIKHWNGGASYFYTNIEHNGGTGVGSVGVIRNHSYKLNISAVTGLGTPVPDPGKEIIPEKPTTDDASYLAATVQVLDWKIVTQEVSLSDK